MSSSSIRLYKRDQDGTLTLEDSLSDSFYKCAMLFSEIESEFRSEANDTFRVDLVDDSQKVTSSKLLYATGHLTIRQIA